MLIIHEIMGRHCGWLTAATVRKYRRWLAGQQWNPGIGLNKYNWDVHAVYLPEMAIDLDAEVVRLKKIMDQHGNVNIFLSEGAGVNDIVRELEEAGNPVPRDAFGHVRLDEINPGAYFANQFKDQIAAEKVLVQKSGYFARSSKSNEYDLELIDRMTTLAVEQALAGNSGVVGNDEELDGHPLALIEFPRIKGAKPFDVTTDWFRETLYEIGQTE
jgi:pyrophosphate--fructose-6-phosphate 1-phosphotransferase